MGSAQKRSFEYIVLGCGGIGSGAAYWLSRRAGSEVLGLEQFELGHVRGGSQDHSRILRMYYHHENYTRLTPHTYTAWKTVEEESALKITTITDGVFMSFPDAPMQMRGRAAEAMDAVGIPYERVDGEEVMRRYPQFNVPKDTDAIFQKDTGIVDAAKGNAAHQQLTRGYGATLMAHTAVKSIQPFDGGVTVDTDNGTFECKRLIITAGAWADKILADVGINLGLTVTQEQVMYYATPNLKKFSIGQFPVFLATGSEGMFYGFPVYGLVATKATVGSTGIVTTADGRSFEPDAEVERDVEEWLNKYIPGFTGPKILSKTCLYARPRDVNFVIDTVPGHPQIIVCNGAGHGYKFSSLLGKILSEMAIDGETEYPIAPFTLQREAITDPNYVRPPFGRESQFTDGAQRTARYGG